MKDISNNNDIDILTKERSFLDWWEHLTEFSLYLFRYNLLYLIVILPSFLCLFIFLIFNAYLFLIVGFLLFLPAGPAILVSYEVADKIASSKGYSTLPHFFRTYKKYWHSGIVFAVVLSTIIFVTLSPVYFAFVINSALKIVILICAMMALLILIILIPHMMRCIIAGEYKSMLKKSIMRAVNSMIASFFAGFLQAIWLFLCILFPYISVIAALIGIPAVIIMSVMYILPQPYE